MEKVKNRAVAFIKNYRNYLIGCVIGYIGLFSLVSLWLYQTNIQFLYNTRWFVTSCLYLLGVYGVWTYKKRTEKPYYIDPVNGKHIAKDSTSNDHFQTLEEMAENCEIDKDPRETSFGTCLGKYEGKPIFYKYPKGSNRNMMTEGISGSGKTASRVFLDLLQDVKDGVSVMMIDSKGSVCNKAYNYIESLGIKTQVLNFTAGMLKHSDGFNPIATISKCPELMEELSAQIANVIMARTESLKADDTYWLDQSYNLLKALIMYVSQNPMLKKLKKNNLSYVYDLTCINLNELTAMIMAGKRSDDPIVKCYNLFLQSDGNKEKIKGGLGVRIQVFGGTSIGKILSNDEVDLSLPMKEQCVYFVIIPDNDTTYNALAGLFFSLAFIEQTNYAKKCKAREKEWLPVHYIMDEYYATGGIQSLPQEIGATREYKIWLEIFLQDRNQLIDMYGVQKARTIMSQCHAQCLISCNDDEIAEAWSKRLGIQDVLVKGARAEERPDAVVKFHRNEQIMYQRVPTPLMSPTELTNGTFERDKVIWKLHGLQPILLDKWLVDKEPYHPFYQDCEDAGLYDNTKRVPEWRRKEKRKERAV